MRFVAENFNDTFLFVRCIVNLNQQPRQVDSERVFLIYLQMPVCRAIVTGDKA